MNCQLISRFVHHVFKKNCWRCLLLIAGCLPGSRESFALDLFHEMPLSVCQDTTPAPSRPFLHKFGVYLDSLRSGRYRDSMLRHWSRQDRPEPVPENKMKKSEDSFAPYSGKVIRHVYFRRLPVFGPRNINDTSFHSSMKLIDIANHLHYNTREWAIRQSLFFKPADTLNAYLLADNERYLRNQPYISDARLMILNADVYSDSVDVLVVTKDEYEYGADISNLTATDVAARVYNNNVLGAAQKLQAGFLWNKNFQPQWGSEFEYSKFNFAGSFTDVSLGYTALNNHDPLDTGVYEGSYYLDIERPLYTSFAQFTGGISLASNYSINIKGLDDSLFRRYRYRAFDIWSGYNFRNRYKRDGSISDQPDLALLFRYYDRYFTEKPSQGVYAKDPVYNNHHFYLAQFVLFKQDFFKTDHFYGFGRTEDIPLGYNIAAGLGIDEWSDLNRSYTGVTLQKYWITPLKGLLNTEIGVSSFWRSGVSQDAVLHGAVDYYSRLLKLGSGYLRQFASADYLDCPNPFFYKPLDINMEDGIWGFKRTTLNGFQRLNLRSQTVYYSPLKLYGFKFNFFASLQASVLSDHESMLFANTMYAGLGGGCQIRNENLPINTLKISVNYYPVRPDGMREFYFELTTVANLRFDIYALKKPGFLQFF